MLIVPEVVVPVINLLIVLHTEIQTGTELLQLLVEHIIRVEQDLRNLVIHVVRFNNDRRTNRQGAVQKALNIIVRQEIHQPVHITDRRIAGSPVQLIQDLHLLKDLHQLIADLLNAQVPAQVRPEWHREAVLHLHPATDRLQLIIVPVAQEVPEVVL